MRTTVGASATPEAAGAPSWALYFSEPIRTVAGLGAWPLTTRLARLAPRAEGRPVLVLPGLLAGDASTRPLRGFLRRSGSHVHGWQLGRNVGPTQRVVDGLAQLVERLVQRHGQPIAIVGWSLGGLYARALAAQQPDAVRTVITLGSPISLDHPSQSRGSRAYERYAHLHVPDVGLPVPEEIRGPLQVPATSIWSRRDGIVGWRSSVVAPSSNSENIVVRASHLGLGQHPGVLWALADRLALPPGSWSAFEPPVWLSGLYRTTQARLDPALGDRGEKI